MTTKEYLQQPYNIHRKVKLLTERVETIRADMLSVKSPKLKEVMVQTSLSNDGIDRLIAKSDEITAEIQADLNNLLDLYTTITLQIDGMPEVTKAERQQREVLYRRYLLYQRWERIAADMDVSTRYVYMVHGDALRSFSKLYKI